ncbi:P-loop ATPase, Sll1717 family [Umezawaea endophytica]|uniref:Uncharacterized protein n=1 Tax=Umezawaea endophytica TaxID=1654476 RepID=A0A9X2VMC5_9PSEU|nr:hypothetical protein [Umezawaea endophytica]MCS7479059.1 hypothetical protein [Umezawaea endophytica]
MPKLRPFKSLYFGEGAAEDEAVKWPELFVKSFYDPRGAVGEIKSGNAFLLIGPKGIGKSSYMEYMRLTAEDKYDTFVDRRDLGELRGALKADVSPVSEADSEVTEMAWSSWIWCQFFDSLMRDQGSSIQSDLDMVSLHQELTAAGIAGGTFSSVIGEVRKRKHKFSVPKIYEYATEGDGARRVHLVQIRDFLAKVVCDAVTESQHILGLDGLDSAEIGTNAYWRQLGSLMRAATAIHRRLRQARSMVRLCVMCRSDVFLKIQIPDSNKIRHGWGVELDWSYGLDTPEDSEIWGLLEAKVAARGSKIDGLIDLYFPQYMEVGARTASKRIRMPRYLLDLTRNTPRDMIMLMKSIQVELYPEQELTVDRVRAGVNRYCRKYFAGEMSNELVGMVGDGVARDVVSSMSRLPGRGFTREQFIEVFSSKLEKNDLAVDEVLGQLYLAGAIASVKQGASEDYVTFYHRRDYAELDLSGPFLIHNALALAVGVRWARAY